MSRLSTLSASAIKAMFSSETDEMLLMLISIRDPNNRTSIKMRLCDGFTQRLPSLTTDDEVIYGVVSGGHEYTFLPIEVKLPGEPDTGVSNCSLVFNYVTPEAIELIRTELTGPAEVSIDLVLSGSPNTIEASFPGFYITTATYNANSISLDLTMIDYAREPFPCYSFTPSYFPGLF
jgi:hypothetical protein